MTTTFIQFKFLVGTRTYKTEKRDTPPLNKPHNAKQYRYFDLNEDIPENLANQFTDADMLNVSPWENCESTNTTRP